MSGKPLLVVVGFATLSLTLGSVAYAQRRGDCARLKTLVVADTTVTSATLIPEGDDLPEYCRVRGRVDKNIRFEVRLPTSWNGKFYFQGGGGFDGVIPPAGPGLSSAYAVAATDSGHRGASRLEASDPSLDGRWALDNPERQVNFGHRSTHVVTVAAKQIVEAFYRRAPRFSYFEGCSNGGREALMEAQRYPLDFDGIIAGAPALDWTGYMMGYNWNIQALLSAPIPMSKASMIADAALAECDGRDGLVDGLISDPRRCKFDPKTLECPAGDAPTCLTPEQVHTALKIYAGPVSSEGQPLYLGFPPGHEDGASGWALWITGDGLSDPLQFTLQDQYLRFFIFGPRFDSLTFNFDTDPAMVLPTGEFLNATNPDLSAFEAAGGKLIMWHGWADHALTAFRSVRYFEEVAQALGHDTDGFFRLFMAPGMHHCGAELPPGGPGPNTLHALTALEHWVEGGTAPERILAWHSTAGVVDRTRPLCPYPKEATYIGSGSIDNAANFVCRKRAGRRG